MHIYNMRVLFIALPNLILCMQTSLSAHSTLLVCASVNDIVSLHILSTGDGMLMTFLASFYPTVVVDQCVPVQYFLH
eukprot:m.356108 g.356108  ORF g.356108 m.356108 type:complete len:77 (+) comp17442_c0_seq1:63-293(+)